MTAPRAWLRWCAAAATAALCADARAQPPDAAGAGSGGGLGAAKAAAASKPGGPGPGGARAAAAREPGARGPGDAGAGRPAPGGASRTAADEAERAKQLFALGAEAFAAQRNADAIRYFRRAAELVPSAKLTYNIALAYEEMRDAGHALEHYRAYLAQEPEDERRDEVLGRIARLERQLAATGVQQLSVRSDPPGAIVRVGDRAVGVTPWTGELTPGQHRVELDLPGHRPRAERVTLGLDRSAQLELRLEPEPPAEPSRRRARVQPLTLTFLGVGAGALAGGLAFELSRASSSGDAERADTPLAAAEARGAASAKQMASILLLGFGGGFLVGGGVLLALDLGGPGEPAAGVRASCAAGFCGLSGLAQF